ncbi:MAG TPA: Fic family protein [Actinocrinis sp.]|nr:Fic family protein [Actinocrinis sp.]
MLLQIPSLSYDDERVLAEIDVARGRIRRQLAEPQPWAEQLRRYLIAGVIRGSNAIAGFHMSQVDAVALVVGEQMSGAVPESTQTAVEGYSRAFAYAQQATKFEVFHYNHMLLSAMHFMLTEHDLPKWPGRYRTREVWIGGEPAGCAPAFEATGPVRVPELMTDLVDWLSDGDLNAHPYVRAAMAHLNLASIRPWRDGNGRMSRILNNLVLAKEGELAPEFCSIEEWLGQSPANTKAYFDALRQVHSTRAPEVDAHSWQFCLRAHHLRAQEIERRLEESGRLWLAVMEIAEHYKLEERTVSALFAAASGHLRRLVYAHDEDLTRDQSIRDVQQLKRLGLIEPVGYGRTQHYVAGAELGNRAGEIHAKVCTELLREPYPVGSMA